MGGYGSGSVGSGLTPGLLQRWQVWADAPTAPHASSIGGVALRGVVPQLSNTALGAWV
jgi:hypothetical protein